MSTIEFKGLSIGVRLTGYFLLILFFGGYLIGCTRTSSLNLEREELFSLSFGKMEDQLDAFQITESPSLIKTDIFMHDGRFYISNGASAKVMVFSSYGDLLTLYYNPEKNPEPLLVPSSASESVTNKRAYPYAFNQIGEIAVASNKFLYIEDRLPEERSVFDGELGVRLNSIVLKFENGEYQGYLGQEGTGGTPFPYIEGITVTQNDEVVVICRTPSKWIVYWFAPNGALFYKYSLSLEDLPVPFEGKVFPSLETILPSAMDPSLFFKISYFKEGVDSQTGIRYGIEHIGTRIYRFDLPEQRFKEFFEVPENIQTLKTGGTFETQEIRLAYELIGIVEGNYFFFLCRQDTDLYQLLILQANGKVLHRRNLRIEDSQLLYSCFHVSREGILSALLVTDVAAKVVWWRSDTLLKER
jgi:hypothetical protein